MSPAKWLGAMVIGVVLLSGAYAVSTNWQLRRGLSRTPEEGDFMRTMLTRSVVALVAAGLLAAICALRPDVLFTQGSAPASRSAAPSAVRPTSSDPHGAAIRPDGTRVLDTGGKWMNAYLLLLTLGHYRAKATADRGPAGSHVEKQASVGGGSNGLDASRSQTTR